MPQRVLCRRSATLLMAVLTATPSCRHSERDTSPAANAVVVTRVAPTTVTVPAGGLTELTIHGRGFGLENTVTIGPVTLTAVKSTAHGTRIVMVLPDRVPSGGGAPPLLWSAGAYALTVSNRLGTSAPVTVTIKDPP